MRSDAVVAGEHREAYVGQRARRHLALHGGEPGAELADPAEGTGRRGKAREPLAREGEDGGGGRRDRVRSMAAPA